jgi:hypothetical protein
VTARIALAAVALLAVASSVFGQEQAASQPSAPPPDDATCAVCHPSETKALRGSMHAALLLGSAGSQLACSGCHVGAQAHLAAAVDPLATRVPAPAVPASSCASCHPGRDLDPALTAHHRAEPASGPGTAALLDEPRTPLLPDPSTLRAFGLDWSALVAAGYRFVDVDGSRDRYKTDVNLDDGFRLTEFELEGRGDADAFADVFRVSAEDIADPYQRLEGLIEKKNLYRGRAGFEKSAVTYRASGDFHRVDQKSELTSFDVSFDVAQDLQAFATFTRAAQEGFWLTNRIGNINLTPQTTIPGVASPRRYDSDETEVGLTGTVAEIRYTAAVEYRDDHDRERWTYSRPSPVNPAFPESEDFSSLTSLRGPGARLSLGRDFDGLSLDVNGRVLDHDRRVVGSGVQTGFDISDFVTTTDAFAEGSATTWLVDGSATLELTDRVNLLGDARWLDHQEDLRLDQTDFTVFPNLGTQTTVPTNVNQHTAQRAFDGTVQLEVAATDWLTLSGGYGWSREWLRVPDLEAGDNDFVSGLIRDDGYLVGMEVRPSREWKLSAEYRDFGQSGPELYEIVEDRSQGASGRLRYQVERFSAETFVKYRHRSNDLTPARLESFTTGLTASVQPADGMDLHGSYVLNDIDSRTLTNFYFDPDPTPVPTFVGFDGQTHTVSAGIGLRPDAAVLWHFDGVYTDTTGSFDVSLLDWQAGVVVTVFPGGEAGFDLRYVDYEDQSGTDDYDAVIAMVYWRQRLGPRRE